MSAYSEAWHAMLPSVRDFYRNFAHSHTRFSNPWRTPEDPSYLEYFTTFGQSFPGSLGWHVAQHNFGAQLVNYGQFNHDLVEIAVPAFTFNDEPEPVYDPIGAYSFGNQFSVTPVYCFNYPRPRYKARKTYWTGAPRRRQNLPY